MMCLIGILIVVHMWAGQETRIAERDAPSLAVADQRSGPIVAQQRTRNRALAFGFGAFVVTIFVSAILVGVLDNLWYHGGDGTGADDATAAHAMHGVPSANLQ